MKGTIWLLPLFSLLISCGEESPVTKPGKAFDPSQVSSLETPDQTDLSRTGNVLGTVKLGTEIPRIPVFKVYGDPVCTQAHPDGIRSNRLVVDQDKNVKWALVHISRGLQARAYPVPKESVVLDRNRCIYEPHVFGIMVGQTLEVRNSDHTLHHAHFLSLKYEHSIIAPRPRGTWTRRFRHEELPVRIKCDIHPWMTAWAGVLDHPYYSVTDEAGRFTLKDVPLGSYTVEVWHEMYEPVTAEIIVKQGESVTVDFELKTKKTR